MATYKLEKQIQDRQKLLNKFKELNTPEFLQEYLATLGSERTKINYLSYITNMMNDIGKPIEDIKQMDIINYLDNLIYNKKQKVGSVRLIIL